MNFLKKLFSKFQPKKLEDPDFGTITYMGGYWEAEWFFPKTKNQIFVSLPGNEDGPNQKGRDFYLGLVERFDWIVEKSKVELEKEYKNWVKKPLPENIFEAFKLSGFDVEDMDAEPKTWNVSYETTGDFWFGIEIYFKGDELDGSSVDT